MVTKTVISKASKRSKAPHSHSHSHSHSLCSKIIDKTILRYFIILGLGIIIGSSFPKSSVLNNNNNNNNNNNDVGVAVAGVVQVDTKSKNSNNEDDGWHTISVYYGKKNAIKAQDAPAILKGNIMEGAQAKQDDIILSLVSSYHNNNSSVSGSDSDVASGSASGSSRKMRSSSSSKTKKNEALAKEFYFVDLAANDAISLSNTFKLEQKGWRGLCIEPNPVYWYRLAHRNCTVAGAFVGGKSDLQEVDVSLSNKEVGGIVGDTFDNKKAGVAEKEKRFTVSIRSLFEKFDVPQTIDYLSLDVEGAEELIMKDFPFDEYKINFVTIERPKIGLQKLMKEQDYHFVMQLVFWGETLWVHGDVLKKISREEVKNKALETMGVGGDEWPPSSWKGTRHFNIESGYYEN